MPNTLSKWFRKKLNNEMNNKMPPLPILPLQRPTVLTPSPSHESLVRDISVPSVTDNIGFFQRFPYEVRRKILIEAFGGQIVHMDISCDDPVLTHSERYEHKKDPTHCSHANVMVPLPQSQLRSAKQWRWWSSVCHRASPRLIGTPGDDGACEDKCRQGSSDWCAFWPGEKPTKCFIGAMGWLLSSRQAYAEGIDVLYSTNTIHMASTIMICHLPQLLLPQRLASITSVEMVWLLRLWQDSSDSGFSTFHNLLDALPLTFPRLKKLHLSLQGEMRPKIYKGKLIELSESAILMPIDDLVRRLPNLQSCDVAIPLSLYDPRKYQATGMMLQPGWRAKGNLERLWRDLPETETGAKQTAHLPGYWVCLGQQDAQLHLLSFGMPESSY